MTVNGNQYHFPYIESNHKNKYSDPNLSAKVMVDRTLLQYIFFFVILGILLWAFTNVILIYGP